jgi:MFS family permease
LHAVSPAWVVTCIALANLGLGALMPGTLVAAQSLAQHGEMGAATGVLLVMRTMGGTFGATQAGVAITLAGHTSLLGFRLGFIVAGALLLLGLVLTLRLPEINLRTSVTAGKPG